MDTVIWKNPEAFWLLWLLPVVVLLAIHAHLRTKAAANAFSGPKMQPRILPPLTKSGPLARTALLVLGLALCIVAAARPAWDVYYTKTKARGVDVAVVLDVSRSMLADDGGEPRLERARSAIASLVSRLEGDRVGLVLFAGSVLEACPLTLDRGFFLAALRDAAPGVVGRGGTRLGPALEAADRMLDASIGRDRVVLLVTDAGDQDSFPKTAAAKLAKKKIRILTVGIGRTSSQESPLILDSQVVRDKKGQPVLAKVNDALLQEIAKDGSGVYIPPDETFRLVEVYETYVAPLEKGEAQEIQEKHYHERYQWFLLPGVVLLLLQLARPRYRRISWERTATGLLLACVMLAGCSADEDTRRVKEAILLAERGEAEASSKLLREVEEDRPDDPTVHYNLGWVHQRSRNAEAAREAYGRVLERGSRPLRARAIANTGVLDLVEALRLGGVDPKTLAIERRAEFRAKLESALDRFQRSHDLDAGTGTVSKRQTDLALYLRNLESVWAERDREEARKQRSEKKGRSFLRALVEAQRGLAQDLGAGELLQNLALRELDIKADLDLLPEKVKEPPGVPETFKEEFQNGIATAGTALEEAADLLAKGRPDELPLALAKATQQLEALLLRWEDPTEAFALVERSATAALGAIEHAKESQSPAQRTIAETLQVMAAEEADLLSRRLGAKDEGEDWPEAVLPHARSTASLIAQESKSASEAVSKDLDSALKSARFARHEVSALARDWSLAKEAAGPLAKALALEIKELDRSLLDADPVAAANPDSRSAKDQFNDLERRAGYLIPALTKALTPEVPEGQESTEEQKTAAEASLKAALGVAALAQESLSSARSLFAEGGWPPDPEVSEELRKAESIMRSLWLSLGDFTAALSEAASEQEELVGMARQALAAAEADPEKLASALRQGSLSLSNLARRQSTTGELVSALRVRCPQEVLAQKAMEPEPGKEAEATPEALEAKALGEALAKVEKLLQQADEATGRASTALTQKADAPSNPIFREALKAARRDQVRAKDALVEARTLLEQAKIPLPELARRIMNSEHPVLEMTRSLIAGKGSQPGRPTIIPESIRVAHLGSVRPFVRKVPPAVDRALAQMRAQKSGEGEAPNADQEKMIAAASVELKSAASDVETNDKAAVAALKAKDLVLARDHLLRVRESARRLWLPFADFKGLLDQAIAEETLVLQATTVLEADADASKSAEDVKKDQEWTRGLVPALERVLDAMDEQAKASAKDAAGQGGAPPSAGLPKEVVELARKNLPLCTQAMIEAEQHLGGLRLKEAKAREEEAKRLLEEIKKKLEEEEKKDEQQQEKKPESGDSKDQKMSDQERERLQRAIEDRAKKMKREQQRPPAKIEEDW